MAWYQQRYGVALDPTAEALSLIGAQEGLAHALMAVAGEPYSWRTAGVQLAYSWGTAAAQLPPGVSQPHR